MGIGIVRFAVSESGCSVVTIISFYNMGQSSTRLVRLALCRVANHSVVAPS